MLHRDISLFARLEVNCPLKILNRYISFDGGSGIEGKWRRVGHIGGKPIHAGGQDQRQINSIEGGIGYGCTDRKATRWRATGSRAISRIDRDAPKFAGGVAAAAPLDFPGIGKGGSGVRIIRVNRDAHIAGAVVDLYLRESGRDTQWNRVRLVRKSRIANAQPRESRRKDAIEYECNDARNERNCDHAANAANQQG